MAPTSLGSRFRESGRSADLLSGFLVSLIALPLCLGIAMASGFPPVAGILTAIVGGLVASHLGSAPLTIKGPAAGMIVIVAGAVLELGHGDPATGYSRALAVGVVAGVIQIIFSILRAGTVAEMMPPSVVHGMMAAIGIIIIGRQFHTLVGVKPEGSEPLQMLAQIPHSIVNANPEVALIGIVGLALLIGLPLIKQPWVKKVPVPMVVLVVGAIGALLFDFEHEHTMKFAGHQYPIGPKALVTLPGSLLGAIHLPDFSVITSATSIKYIVLYSLVGSLESMLTVAAADGIDPEKRVSNTNRDLFATGVANTIVAGLGGLPMISEVVRTKANIDAGARSSWSNFAHGAFLLVAVSAIPSILHLIPLAALAAMLIFTGFRLASPKEFAHAKEIGLDQLALFVTTCVVTLATDLLIGVASGIALQFLMHAIRGGTIGPLFKLDLRHRRDEEELHISAHSPVTFLNMITLRRSLVDLGDDVKRVVINFSEARIVDHTVLAKLERIGAEWPARELIVAGLDRHRASSRHKHSSRELPREP